jgi:hypothetical protein
VGLCEKELKENKQEIVYEETIFLEAGAPIISLLDSLASLSSEQCKT